MTLTSEPWGRNWPCNGCHDSKCSCEPVKQPPKPFLTLETTNGMTIAKKAHPNVVVVIAINKKQEIILATQYREGVKADVIGLPAGHIGDEPGKEKENALEAAKRELLEETGYGNGEFTYLGSSATSPGMTDEITHFVLADKVEKVQKANSGDENITVREVPLSFLRPCLYHQSKYVISTQMLAGLWAYNNYNIIKNIT